MTRPLTVSLTPAFLMPGDWLLRAQLKCLSQQSAKDFDIVVIDPHFLKRKGYMPELAERYRLNIVHVPYTPNTRIAKRLDCSIFNAAYCYSESPRIVRYSCWRFVRPDFTKACLGSDTNVDFRFHSCEPVRENAKFIHSNDETNHNELIWDGKSDLVNWHAVPERAGEKGATWGPDSDKDEPSVLFPTNCYGNYMVFRNEWLNINGCDESWSSTAHYEDMDFCLRARNAGMKCSRKSHSLYRLHHLYGSHAQRANVPPDVLFKTNCPACERACSVLEPNRFDLKGRSARGEIDLLEGKGVWVCKTCFLCGPIYHADCAEHLTAHVSRKQLTKSNIIPKYRIGRNLRTLTGDMDGKPLAEKISIFNDSWNNERYYQI